MRNALLALTVLCLSGPGALAVAEPMNGEPPSYTITAPVIQQTTEYEVQASGGVTIVGPEWTLKAQHVTGDLLTSTWTAEGEVEFLRGDDSLRADAARFSGESRTGSLTRALGNYGVFRFRSEEVTLNADNSILLGAALGTTCGLPHPHWSISADSIRIVGAGATTDQQAGPAVRAGGQTFVGEYAVARRLKVRIGGTTLFSLPAYRLPLQRRATALLPTPGYDSRDGAYLRYTYPLIVPWASAVQVSARMTHRNGILASFDAQREVPWRRPLDVPGELSSEVPTDITSLNLLTSRPDRRSLLPGSESSPDGNGTAHLPRASQTFLRLTWKERVFDPDAEYLHVDKLPEFGVRLTGLGVGRLNSGSSPFSLDSQVGYGRFRERPEDVWRSRFDARAVARLNTRFGRQWLMEPALFARISHYSTGESQRILAGSIAVGREISSKYFASIAYVRHITSGQSPFEFDDLDVKDKLATRLEADLGKTRGSLTLDFDLKRGGVYDWGVNLAHIFHCIEPRVSYRHRYGDLSLGIAFVGGL